MGVQAQRSTDHTRASQRASEGASGVERITLLLRSVKSRAGEGLSWTQDCCEEARNL